MKLQLQRKEQVWIQHLWPICQHLLCSGRIDWDSNACPLSSSQLTCNPSPRPSVVRKVIKTCSIVRNCLVLPRACLEKYLRGWGFCEHFFAMPLASGFSRCWVHEEAGSPPSSWSSRPFPLSLFLPPPNSNPGPQFTPPRLPTGL